MIPREPTAPRNRSSRHDRGRQDSNADPAPAANVPGFSHEWRGLLLIAIIAIGLRFAFPGRLAIEHFDEGVYAANLFFDADTGFRYPDQHLYAPPLLPALIEWLFVFLGPGHFVAMLPSLIAGSLTPIVVWSLGRRWFRPEAGMWAGALAACSDVHILFSRTALTDVLLTFWLLLALCALTEALTRTSNGWGIVTGLCVSLAWWSKYNGWLPIAISVAAIGLLALVDRSSWRWLIGRGRVLAVVIVVAAALWSPWLWSLQDEGGYGAVAANHRLYIVGLAGWFDSFLRQAGNLQTLTRGVSVFGPLVGWLAVTVTREEVSRTAGTQLLFAGLCALLSSIVGVSVVLAALAVGAILVRLANLVRNHQGVPDEAKLSTCLVAVWFLGLLLVTPLYRPYARLMLPWLAACWLAAGEGMRLLTKRMDDRLIGRRVWAAGGVAAVSVVILVLLRTPTVPGWESRQGLAKASERLLGVISQTVHSEGTAEGAFIIYVYAEPASLFELRRGGAELVGPVAHLGFVDSGSGETHAPTFLVTGPHAERDPQFAKEFARVGDKLEWLATEKYHASSVVRLDEATAPDAASSIAGEQELKLYRVR